jgi:hypothetical protein
MKINFIKTIIGIAVGSLIAYALFSIHHHQNKILISIGSFIFFAVTLVFTFGTSFEYSRTTTNVRVVSGVFFVVALISNLIFAFINFSVPSYVIINGILLLIFTLITYSIGKAKQ